MTSKKILVILIIIVMTAGLFTSCDETDEDMQTTTAESSQQKEDIEVVLLPDLPDYDWEGVTLRVLTYSWDYSGWGMYSSRDIVAEEETGEPINDAVYRRNLALEEKYNFTIERVVTANPPRNLEVAVLADDRYFDVISSLTTPVAKLAQRGFLADLFSVDYLDFEKPWWDNGAITAISIGKKLFVASGDLLLINRDLCAAVLFNKALLKDLQLENPYELVQSNRWTLDTFFNMSRSAAADLNGNGVMDSESDRFGYVTDIGPMQFLHGMGVRLSTKDKNDLPVLTYESERTFSALDAILNLLFADFRWAGVDGLMINEDESDTFEIPFSEGRSLFMSTNILSVESLRGADIDFGILPMPKFDENQRDWGSSVNSFYSQVVAVPTFHTEDELSRIGFMLEAISAESRYTVIPAYYDIQLQGKFVRDEESLEMLDIIFSSTVWDTGAIYNWFDGGFGTLTASAFESQCDRIEAAMQATVDAFAALE